MKKKLRFNSRVIHGGQSIEKGYGAVIPPIYQTSTYAQTSPGNHKGYEYSRTHNPTRTALENSLASIESGRHGLVFASGLAAMDAILKLLNSGDEIIASNDLYGGSFRLLTKIFNKFKFKSHFLDLRNINELKSKINNRTKLIWVETPTNPMMNIIDIKAIRSIVREKKIILAVDNTFASPYLQNPLLLGADIVMHSATKYIAGHSDVILGAIIVNSDDLAEKLAFIQNASGAVPGPMDCFLTLRGIKTLSVRMERHCYNGKKIAQFLNKHPRIDKVFWPGFRSNPNYNIAKQQMKDFGAMISFIPKEANYKDSIKIIKKLNIFTLAESLGGVESLSGHPASMTHASIPKEIREKSGVLDSLIRLSIGIEDEKDLIDDLKQALNK
ncbi:MAG: cystathionine gamma-synthase [Flavobacteriaceae bacterium]|nr:cystathionine gamma-synthase [Flavobacteriaceae bacterium]|tara:strand:+ start:31176 stop:32330 length:1155 start_codon:yes stop_codon:yes gene_type:complete